MSRYTTAADDSTVSLPSYPPNQQQHYDPDYKASYDDFDDHDDFRAKTGPSEPMDSPGPYPFAPNYSTADPDFEGGYGGQPAPPTKYASEKTMSLWSRIWLHSLPCRLFVLTVVLQTVVDLVIEGNMILQFADLSSEALSIERMRVYLVVFALAHVFQFILAIDAVYNRNTLQFFFLCMFNALFLIYSVVQIHEVSAALPSSASSSSAIPINVLTRSIPVVIAICEVAYLALGYRIYNEFGWQVYKFLGADRRIKKMYGTLQVFNCIIKFDLFFWIGFSVQFIWLVLQSNHNAEYYITYAVFPLSVLLLAEGHLAARHENKPMMYTFLVGCVGALVYFVYKLYKTLLTMNDPQNTTIWESLTIFAVIAILLLFATFFYAMLVLRNFGHGLKTQIDKSQSQQQHKQQPSTGAAGVLGFSGGKGSAAERRQTGGQFPMSSNPYRMSIE